MTTTFRIHPAIGIARLGNAPLPEPSPPAPDGSWFYGPENVDDPPQDRYKADRGRVKKQAARFRIYEFSDDKLVREVTSRDAEIEWEVHLANRRATREGLNPGIPEERLVVDPGRAQTIAGENRRKVPIAGSFQGSGAAPRAVLLGHLATDEHGRLVVLGGDGKSFSPSGVDPSDIWNPDWCDDTSDGPVRARVRFPGGGCVEAESAWVIAAPPHFAPPVRNVVSLYDVVYQAALAKSPTHPPTHYDPLLRRSTISFKRHVYPVLERAVNLWWVTARDAKKNYLDPEVLPKLANSGACNAPDRERVYDELAARLMDPDAYNAAMEALELAEPQAKAVPSELALALPFFPWQVALLEQWRLGNFVADLERPTEEEPWIVLDKASLASCVGDHFIPGIEAAKKLRDSATYRAPFRIGIANMPGSLTLGLSIPWQADYSICSSHWPVQRPQVVFRGSQRKTWDEGVASGKAMVDDWARLGFVLPSGADPAYVEKERDL